MITALPQPMAEWRRKLEQFHRDHEVPWRRFQFAEALLERAEELEAVGDLATCALLQQRLERWMEREQRSGASGHQIRQQSEENLFLQSWSEQEFNRAISELRNRLELFRELIPRSEWLEFVERCDRIESALPAEGRGAAMQELRKLRTQLVERCFRSMGAIELRDAVQPSAARHLQELPVGPYNSSATLSELLGAISQTDPIWTGDFIALYGSLYRLARQIG